MRMDTRWARLAAACGALYPIALVVGDDVIARGDEAAPDAGTPDEILAAMIDKDVTSFYLGRSLGVAAWMLLFVFAAHLAVTLRRRRGNDDVLPALVLGSGAIVTALALASAVFQIRTVRRAGDGLDPTTAVTFLDMGFGFGLVALPLAVLLGAVAVEATAGAIMARSLGWAAAVLAIAQLAGFVLLMLDNAAGFLAMMATWAWFIAAGISTWRRAAYLAPSDPRRSAGVPGVVGEV
ncbi:hypothetical protein [Jiangella asiatica]|uniref:DUF4386 family protein n=1 Tax=Jiangella asiatica TaxID=2530372 RepID=A0A4R5DK47_9ACTN|nr:hypothetical protein [Jiangella asiatica]TDE11215.1 hypothetical protein E1269_10135 [Jiangella asiatica]